MKDPTFKLLDINDIELDVDNPRIKHFIEIYNEVTSESLAMALNGGATSENSASYKNLKESIKVSEGIIHPIVVNQQADGKYVVIEGNTRLQIFREFNESDPEGPWKKIKSLVYDGLTEDEKHQIRLQSHLVGPREWDPYSKAKYLHQLSEIEHMPVNQIISLCGGDASGITKSIETYQDMQKYYRPLVPEDQFDPSEYSKFLEAQNRKIQNSMLQKNYGKADFAKWVVDGHVDKAQKVRLIPEIMKNDKALAVFLKKNISEAEKELVITDTSKHHELDNISYEALCNKLNELFAKIELGEVKCLAKETAYTAKRSAIFGLADRINELVGDINYYETK